MKVNLLAYTIAFALMNLCTFAQNEKCATMKNLQNKKISILKISNEPKNLIILKKILQAKRI